MKQNSSSKFRHELKYLITREQMEQIKKRISVIMNTDEHAKDGRYMIRSLYFDDLWESAYNEKMSGTSSRKKYRVRCYNGSSDVIKLERKRKEGQYINKVAVNLSAEEFYRMLSGEIEEFQCSGQRLKQDFYLETKINQMKPKVIVDYEREPYVYPFGDVRITFDTNIRVALSEYNIFNMELPTIEVLPEDQLIMEVKYTEYLPEIIRDILPTEGTVHTAASKYVLCLEKQKEFCRR